MKMTTPGPWHADHRFACHSVITANETEIAKTRCDVQFAATNKADANLIAASPEMYGALRFVKAFLAQLEDGLPEDDPLTKIRRQFHAPMHERIDAALSKADGRRVAARLAKQETA